MMKRTLATLVLSILLCCPVFAATLGDFLPADEAMQRLKDGNARHVGGETIHDGQGVARREELAKAGQRPIATILGCSDSRAPLEIIFDQGVGDIFAVRVAGNVAGPSELGSIEYGVASLGSPVVLVLGHSSCGAVSAAVHNSSAPANVAGVINQIRPAVAKAKAWSPNASGADLVNKSVKANVWQSMEAVLRKSREVRARVLDGRILLVGGVYDLESGQVAWLGQHPDQGKILAAIHSAENRPKPRPKAEAAAKVQEPTEPPAEAEHAEAAAASTVKPADKPAAQDLAKPAATASTKPAAKPAAKAEAKPVAKIDAKPVATIEAKPVAKPAPAAEPSSGYNPQARSEGDGELLAPIPEKAPAKSSSKETGKKGS